MSVVDINIYNGYNFMKRTTLLFIGLIGVLLVSACQSSTTHTVMGEGKPLTYVGSENMVADTTIFESVDFFICEDVPEAMFSQIVRAEEYDGAYYLLDPRLKQVIMLDNSGKHLKTLRRIGGGQGEWADIHDIAIDRASQRLLILASPPSILSFSLDGEYIEHQKLEKYYNAIGVDDKCIYLSRSTYSNNELSTTSVSIIDKQSGQMTETLPPPPELAPYCYAQGRFISGTGVDLFYMRRFDDQIYRLTPTGVDVAYSIDWQDAHFPESEKDHQWECSDFNELCMDHGYVYTIVDVAESAHSMAFRTNQMGVYIVDKQKGTICKYGAIESSLSGLPLPGYLPVGGSSGEVIFVYPANLLLMSMQFSKKQVDSPAGQEFRQRLGDITEESNPVIFRCKLK